ncbi:MAG: hypothetical protein J5713_01930 [Clostridia bacterium]|nr:hypothetical protein [Clostridia bacterium]
MIAFEDFKKKFLDKLENSAGRGTYEMLRGKTMELWLSKSGDGIENSCFKHNCLFSELYSIYKKAIELGGKMYLGATAAQGGKRIGSEDFSVDTIDAFVSMNFYGKTIGDTATRMSTYYAAILAWGGFARNCWGGYIVITPNYR